jgi:hypothetical protein
MSAVFRSAKAPAFADCIGSTLSAKHLTITSESHCLSPRKCRLPRALRKNDSSKIKHSLAPLKSFPEIWKDFSFPRWMIGSEHVTTMSGLQHKTALTLFGSAQFD